MVNQRTQWDIFNSELLTYQRVAPKTARHGERKEVIFVTSCHIPAHIGDI